MGDRMFASEGDSGYVARLGPGWDGDRSENGPPPRPQADDATAGVARRLQGRLDRHLWLLDRVAAEPLPESPELPELLDTAARMRRDTESLLLLCGHEPGVRATGPRRLDELVSDVAALAEEPRRVEVRPAPEATIGSAAAVEFLHVLAELVDHTTAVHPGARLELAARIESGGATVDVVVDGLAPGDLDSTGARRAAAAAEQLSRRSRYGIVLHRPLGGPPPSGSGLIASVHCPPASVTVPEPVVAEPPPASRTGGFPQYAGGGVGGLGSDLGVADGFGGSLAGLSAGLGSAGVGNGLGNGLGNGGLGNGGLAAGWTSTLGIPATDAGIGDGIGTGHGTANGNGLGNGTGNGSSAASRPLDAPAAPAYSPSQSSQVDELFGPLLDLPLEPIDDRYATPIFEAIASAWFKEGDAEPAGDGGDDQQRGPLDWETPQDSEWREAAARAARSEPTPTTATGLPRRQPGTQLVPPPRTQNGRPAGGAGERVPDRVRDRLSTYQRGLNQGRHRAPGEEGLEPEDW